MKSLKPLFNLTVLAASLLWSGCADIYNLPEEKEFISNNINYATKVFEPILGRNNLFGNINSDNSSLPLTFEIVNARYGDGRPVTDLFQTRPVYVWTQAYDGLEKSLEEIEAKRKIEERPLFEVRSSGQFILWASATDDLVEPRPTDSSDLTQDIRFFDLRVSNSGGERMIYDFQIVPWRERPYEPSNDINPYTGGVAPDPRQPSNPTRRDYLRPRLINVIGERTERALVSNDEIKDVVAFIRPFEGGNGHTLRVKVLDTNDEPIPPSLFNETDWERQVHGFNRRETDEYVEWDVAYPVPLVDVQTNYTTNGNARFNLRYFRRGFGGIVSRSEFGLDFRIFRKGDWEVVIKFMTDNPKFEDE